MQFANVEFFSLGDALVLFGLALGILTTLTVLGEAARLAGALRRRARRPKAARRAASPERSVRRRTVETS